jgi:hypothetical protein
MMAFTILGTCVVPTPAPKADADPDLVLGQSLVTGARAVRLRPGDVVFFARLDPRGEFQVWDGCCEDTEEEDL